jgi:outer membrane protein TolC
MRSILLIIYILLLSSSALFAEQSYLDELITEAIANNPNLHALKKDWESKEARIVSEKWDLPKPVGSVEFFGEPIQTKTGPQKSKYKVKQIVPFPTKLFMKGRIADKNAQIARVRYVLGTNELIRNLKSYFYDYYYISKAINVFEEEKLILDNMRMAVQRKYEGLEVPQQDLIKVNLELAGIDDKIISSRKRQNLLEQQIRLGVEEQEHKLSLAKQEYIPDIGLMGDYMPIGDGTTSLSNDGNDAWSIGGSLDFPLWFWKINSNIKSERLKYESEKNRYADKENFIALKVEDLYFKLKSNYQLVDLYENVIVPQAQQNFSTSRISYEGGEVDFLSWLDAERNLIKLKVESVRQSADYKKVIAQLEYVAGQQLEYMESINE